MQSSYIVFRLHGQLAGWGKPAVGELRYTESSPTRSAIVGLIAAALGIRREDSQDLGKLNKSVLLATKQIGNAKMIEDFHTVQMQTNSKSTYCSRKMELLNQKSVATLVSNRYYVADAEWIVALSLKDDSFSLEQIQAALLKPKFNLYLGRKSCPLALPMSPVILSGITLKEALDHDFPSLSSFCAHVPAHLKSSEVTCVYTWEGDKDCLAIDENAIVMTYQARNNPIDRKLWLFDDCVYHQVQVTVERN